MNNYKNEHMGDPRIVHWILKKNILGIEERILNTDYSDMRIIKQVGHAGGKYRLFCNINLILLVVCFIFAIFMEIAQTIFVLLLISCTCLCCKRNSFKIQAKCIALTNDRIIVINGGIDQLEEKAPAINRNLISFEIHPWISLIQIKYFKSNQSKNPSHHYGVYEIQTISRTILLSCMQKINLMHYGRYIQANFENYKVLEIINKEKSNYLDPRPRYTESVPMKGGYINLEFIYEPPFRLHFSTPDIGSENVDLYDPAVKFNLDITNNKFELIVNEKKKFSFDGKIGFKVKMYLIMFYSLNKPSNLNVKFYFKRNITIKKPLNLYKTFQPILLEGMKKSMKKEYLSPQGIYSKTFDVLQIKGELSDQIFGLNQALKSDTPNPYKILLARNWMQIHQIRMGRFNITYDDIAAIYSPPSNRQNIGLLYIRLRKRIAYQYIVRSDDGDNFEKSEKRYAKIFELSLQVQECNELQQFLIDNLEKSV